MARHQGFMNKISKESRDRHFPELNGGKGSKPRKPSKTKPIFDLRFDLAFGTKEEKEFARKLLTEMGEL